jgi:hypothetical protein
MGVLAAEKAAKTPFFNHQIFLLGRLRRRHCGRGGCRRLGGGHSYRRSARFWRRGVGCCGNLCRDVNRDHQLLSGDQLVRIRHLVLIQDSLLGAVVSQRDSPQCIARLNHIFQQGVAVGKVCPGAGIMIFWPGVMGHCPAGKLLIASSVFKSTLNLTAISQQLSFSRTVYSNGPVGVLVTVAVAVPVAVAGNLVAVGGTWVSVGGLGVLVVAGGIVGVSVGAGAATPAALRAKTRMTTPTITRSAARPPMTYGVICCRLL